jgi:hypothetical protein
MAGEENASPPTSSNGGDMDNSSLPVVHLTHNLSIYNFAEVSFYLFTCNYFVVRAWLVSQLVIIIIIIIIIIWHHHHRRRRRRWHYRSNNIFHFLPSRICNVDVVKWKRDRL